MQLKSTSYLLVGEEISKVEVLTNRVGHQAGGDSDSPAKQEGNQDASILAQQQWFQGVVEAKVHPPVDEDANSRDCEASVEALDPVRLEGFNIDVNQTIELALATLALGIIGKPVTTISTGQYDKVADNTGIMLWDDIE